MSPRRRALVHLGSAYALAWVVVSMLAGPGAAAIVRLTGQASSAGMYIAAFSLGIALGGMLGGRLMDTWGRLPVLRAGYGVTALGSVAAWYARDSGPWWLFLVATVVLASGLGTANLTRIAAAGMFPVAERGRAVSVVQASATVGAVVGPLLLVLSAPLGRLTGVAPLDAVWTFAAPVALLALLALTGAPEPGRLAAPMEPPRAIGSVTSVGMPAAVLVLVQAAMLAVMGVAGAAVIALGGTTPQLGGFMLLHFVGMFGLSRLAGHAADRFGRVRTIVAGLGLSVAAGLVIGTFAGFPALGAGLFLSGVGWSFAYIGATLLVADRVAPERRARVTGRIDFVAALVAGAVSATAGLAYGLWGLTGLGLAGASLAALALGWALYRPVPVVRAPPTAEP